MVIFAVRGIQGQGLPGDARVPTNNPDARTPKFENCVSLTSYQFKFSKTTLNTVPNKFDEKKMKYKDQKTDRKPENGG